MPSDRTGSRIRVGERCMAECLLAMPLPEITSIHEQYLALNDLARKQFTGALGGRILLSLGPAGAAGIVAASVAGAASLWLDGDAEELRAGMRAGLCDFVVGTLDEALRILKNEVRQKRPVSVGVPAQPQPTLAEMVERGFQPDLILGWAASEQSARMLVERGAVVLPATPEPEPNTSLLCWTADAEAARVMPRIAGLAAESLDSRRADTPARSRWLEVSPRYLGRNFARQGCVRMDRHESAAFVARVRGTYPAVRLTCNGAGI
jgi:hypothetical protein